MSKRKSYTIVTNSKVFQQTLKLHNALIECSTMCLCMLGDPAYAPEARNLYAAIKHALDSFDGTSIIETNYALLKKADKARKQRRSHARKE